MDSRETDVAEWVNRVIRAADAEWTWSYEGATVSDGTVTVWFDRELDVEEVKAARLEVDRAIRWHDLPVERVDFRVASSGAIIDP